MSVSPTADKYADHYAQFAYDLSPFQKKSIAAIVDGHHVFTAAPTGSGKTVSAEFAIRHFAVNGGRRVIFTSPIKALSNQKYHDFVRQFPTLKIGLATGDIKLCPDADVVIATTEILHNHLFARRAQAAGAAAAPPALHFNIDVDTELACVIFDEVHYILDKHRGGVWERTIAMLPEHVQLVMLSATFARPERFAKWVYDRHGGPRQVVVASTDRRAVPLVHYAFFAATEAIFKTVKDKVLLSRLRASTNTLMVLKDATTAFSETTHDTVAGLHATFDKHDVRVNETFAVNRLLTHLKEAEMLPAIVFVFSRKHAEKLAARVHCNLLEDDSKIPYTAAHRCESTIRKLPNHAEYTALPEYTTIVGLAEKGVAFHHSGMIAVFRELVEMLIAERFIKVLFCTESFSIGLNCPIRTAVFTDIAKFDGDGRRNLLPHEYQQCAGRAGRRGIDTIGHVVHCSNMIREKCKVAYRRLLSAALPSLESALSVDVATVLAMLRAGGAGRDTIITYFKGTIMAMDVADAATADAEMAATLAGRVARRTEAALALRRAPAAACSEFASVVDAARTANLKGRKKLLARAAAIREEWPSIEADARAATELAAMREDADAAADAADARGGQVEADVERVVAFMSRAGLASLDGDIVTLTETGKAAAMVAEANGPVVATALKAADYFRDTPLRNIAAWLAMLGGAGEKQRDVPDAPDAAPLDPCLATIAFACRAAIATVAAAAEPDSPERAAFEFEPNVRLAAAVLRWVAAATPEECRFEIQTNEAAGLSAGEFTKSVLKVAALAREVAAAATEIDRLDLAAALAGIDAAVLKYIANAQSLYV